MRRGTILVMGLLLAPIAMPPTQADARPLLLKILRAGPLGPVFGAGRYAGPRAGYQQRRAAAIRAARARAVARSAAPAAAVAGVAGATAAIAANNPSDTPDARTGATNPQMATTGSASTDEPRAVEPVRQAARLGTVGPLAWPSAYEDVVGFALWPKEYGERLRAHGIADVLGTALVPSATLAARTRANNAQARADEPNAAPVAAGCGSVDLTATDWPIAQIATSIELDAAQRGALDQLTTALSDAIASIKSTCRGDEAGLTPVERIQVMQNTLWAVHGAAQLIRGPLARFYDSLTDQQKQQFAAPAPQQANARGISRADMARMCGAPVSNEAPMRQIEQSLRPTKAQRASLDALQKTSSEMGQFLMASCLKPIEATPAARLDAAADRLTAVIFAASNVNITLNDFTSQLSDEQKSKLNSLR